MPGGTRRTASDRGSSRGPGVRGQESGVSGRAAVRVLLTLDPCLLTPGPGLVQVKVLVDIVVGLGRLAVAVAIGAEFAHRVGDGPTLVLHPIDRHQGAGAVQAGHAVDQDRVVVW